MLKFPDYAYKCINTIIENGYEAYFVGGCVRDGLLERECEDIDITTSATPEQIISLFENTVPTGIKHGTVTVISDEHSIEVTTFRQESGYKDSRHPDKVVFVSNLEDDLSRRDFTINAIACSKDGEIIDLFGGLNDLETGIIRAVGDPEKRFEEDALRIVRAYRFASVLGFKIEENTEKAALKHSRKIAEISGERVLSELKKCVVGARPSAICKLLRAGALKNFGISGPRFSDEITDRLPFVDIAPSYMLAIFICMCEHDTNLIKSVLKADHVLLTAIEVINDLSKQEIPTDKKHIQKMLYKHHIGYVRVYFYYLFAIGSVTDDSLFSMMAEILDNSEAYRISHLNVNGNDLTELGFEGPEIKKALEKALFAVIDEDLPNTRETLLEYLKN